MARLCAVADGNNTSASTWALIDSTSYNESESSSISVPTTYSTSYTQFTPGAITVDGIGIRLATRVGTTGTFSVELYNHTGGASVAGTEVTINCSDFAASSITSLDGGWYFFKFGSPVTLLAATAYSVRFKTSSASQINCHGSASTNPSRFLRTTTTQAPVAGDDRIVVGEWTAAATMTSRTVTMDDTSTVDYGSGSTSSSTPALSISRGGVMVAATSASTTYIQKISGNVVVYNGGVLRIGTSGTRMPTTSSFTWTFDCATNVDFGIDVRAGGEFSAYGESKTRWTLLTGDEAAAQTVIGVADTTGWKTNDTLVFAATGTTNTHGETKTISTVDSATQVTLSAGLTNAHTGTGDVVGEVGNLTSNVKLVGASQTLAFYCLIRGSALVVLDNVEIQYYGSSTANKRGFETQHIYTSSNSCTFNSCVFKDAFNNASTYVGNIQLTGAFYYITNCVFSSAVAARGIIATGGSTGTPTFDISNNLITGQSTAMGTGLEVSLVTGVSGTCTNNRVAGCSTGLVISTSPVQDTTSNISGFKLHSCTTGMALGNSQQTKNISTTDVVCNSTGISTLSGSNYLDTCNFIGNSTTGVSGSFAGLPVLTQFTSCVFRGRTSFSQPSAISLSTNYNLAKYIFNSCTFGVTTAHTTADIAISTIQSGTAIFNSCTFASTTEFSATIHTFLDEIGSFRIQRKDDTDGDHVTYIRQGVVTPDTSIFRTASPSVRITPKSATIEATSKLFAFSVPINNGQTCTPTVYVRESVVGDGTDYNGNRIKLYVKANYNLGITSDTLLDTATGSSEGAFEALTGTTATVTDDGVLEFYLTCDGTTGWINYDDFSATLA